MSLAYKSLINISCHSFLLPLQVVIVQIMMTYKYVINQFFFLDLFARPLEIFTVVVWENCISIHIPTLFPLPFFFLRFLCFYYSRFTLFCQILLYSRVTQSHTHTHTLFLTLSSIMLHHK